jgi:hypothetical protein
MPQPDQEPRQETSIIPADVAIHAISTDEGTLYYGHGTSSIDRAEGVVAEGLHLRSGDFLSTTYGLASTSNSPLAVERNTDTLNNWRHHNFKTIVILGVEQLAKDQMQPGINHAHAIVQKREGTYDALYGLGHTIDKRFIAGYFDMTQGIFRANPDFDPSYDPKLLETTTDLSIQMRLRPYRSRRLPNFGIAASEIVVAAQNDHGTE